LPILKPPWGRITAIDLNTGEHVWMVPNADTPDFVKNHPLLKGVDLPRTGRQDRSGLMVTKTLLFAGEGSGLFAVPPGAGGPMFRAYDKQTGSVLWEFTLPANQSGVPMTYMTGGRQYIVVPVGAPNHAGELVALSLPNAASSTAGVVAQATKTQWSGIYSQVQAKRGEGVYQQNCTSCHGPTLTGAEGGPPLVGQTFAENWDGMALWDLFDKIHSTMPQSAPGSLTDKQCADLLAYIMRIGEAPAGDGELSTEASTLKAIKYQAAKP
jgi:mono/diheme cytochrome c family protein